MARLRGFTALIALAGVLATIVGCTPPAEDPQPTSEPAAAGVVVTMSAGPEPTVEVADLAPAAVQGITDIGTFTDFILGTPIDITLDSEFPEAGATLERTYPAPLPDGAAATFAYWDEEYEAWTAAPTTISSDRRTITAVVHHFSIWTDIVAGTKDALTKVRDAAVSAGSAVAEWGKDAAAATFDAFRWSLGNIFTTRVELPECTSPTPNWVITLPVSVEVNDPVRFCAGRDPNNPELLIVKAQPNRGYGYTAVVNASEASQLVTQADQSGGPLLEDLQQTLISLDSQLSDSAIEMLAGDDAFLHVGEELTITIPHAGVAVIGDEFLIEMVPPTVPQFLYSVISQAVVAAGIAQAEGTLVGALSVAGCAAAVVSVDDIGSGAVAAVSCLTAADQQVKHVLANAFNNRGLQKEAAVKRAGAVVARATMVLALMPAVLNTAEYIGELTLDRSVRSLKGTFTAQPSASDEGWLISSEGVGPLKVGMTRNSATSSAAWDRAELIYQGCPAFSFALRGQHLTAHVLSDWGAPPEDQGDLWYIAYTVDAAQSPTARTAEGIGIGSTEAELQAAYGSQLISNTDLSTPPFSFMGLSAIYILDTGNGTINFAVSTDGIVQQIDVAPRGSKWVMYEACG